MILALMKSNDLIYKCRVCLSSKIEIFKIDHLCFSPKNNDWKSFFCFNCGAVSEFNLKNEEDIYASSSYRDNKNHFNENLEDGNVLPPIDPWSAISFKRWRHIYDILKNTTSITQKKEFKMLDFGGYNGFLPYAFNQKNKVNSFVADLDKKGLKMAEFLGSKIINLSTNNVEEKNFDLITFVHVLEHLDYPKNYLEKLKKNLSNDGIIYAEVPNLYGFPLGDPAHNIAFTRYSLGKIFLDLGFDIIACGFTSTPKESVKFDYFYTSQFEAIYVVAALKDSKNNFIRLPIPDIPNNIKMFKYNLNLSYVKIMIKFISLNLFKLFFKYFKKFILYLTYGLIELVYLKIFKISFGGKTIISKLIKKKPR